MFLILAVWLADSLWYIIEIPCKVHGTTEHGILLLLQFVYAKFYK